MSNENRPSQKEKLLLPSAFNSSTTMQVLAKRRILLAESDEMVRDVVRDALELQGYEVDEAECATEALALMRVAPPDLVILDGDMTDIVPFQFLGQVRQDSRLSAIPIVALGSFSPDTDWNQRQHLDFDEYISKDLSILAMAAAIESYVRASSPHAAIRTFDLIA